MSKYEPSLATITESLGPDAWNKDNGAAPYGLNDISIAVAEEAYTLILNKDYEGLGRLIAHHSTEYLNHCASSEGSDWEGA